MKIEELKKLVDLEIQWLYYYGHSESRQKLNENSNIYKDIVPIGYTKRVMKLDLRCCPCVITAEEKISEGMDISKLIKISDLRGNNKLSPIETYITIFPEKKMEIFGKLKPNKIF